MLKKIVSLTLILVYVVCSICFAERMTDSRGYMRNGKLEEYDRRAKESNSAGFDKRGYYIEPHGRNEMATGRTDEEWDEIDKNTPSLYFYPDGRPKPGTFSTPEERKALQEQIERRREERHQEYLARQRRSQLEKEERQRKSKESQKMFFWVIFGTIAQLVGLRVLAFIMRKISDYEECKSLEKRNVRYINNDNNTTINWNCFDKKAVNRKKTGTCLFREAQCYSCKHRFMWHRLSNVYYEYYFKDTKEVLEYAKCPKCGSSMLLISGELEGIPEDKQGVIKRSI